MKALLCFVPVLVLLLLASGESSGQAENLPVSHSAYAFLKRMELKGIISRYHDAILPISRKEVADFLNEIQKHEGELSSAERGFLHDFLREFQYDRAGTLEGFHTLIDSESETFGSALAGTFSDREKFLYAFADSNLSFFVNGLFSVDARRISGDALGSDRAEFIQFGGRVRGTVFGKLGYYLLATNAHFWGSRDLLRRDRVIRQAYTLNVLNAKNFDFVEGYARFDGGIVSAQVGRERLLWGNGFSEKMIASDNVRVYDFIRADAKYKAMKYTFVHAWLLGKRTSIQFVLPSDSSVLFNEPVVADKYFAAHRIEFSFPRLFDVGGQEMVIYSNRSPDLAYLNPITLIESAQRSREERDNVFWAFDIQAHFIPRIELHGTFLLDDLNFPDLFTDTWSDRHAIQAGAMYVDPFGIENMSLKVEYTKVKPYVFSHNRSRDNDYGSLGAPLGPRIGPNADAWFYNVDILPTRNLSFSLGVSLERQGENWYNAAGELVNVGGDILQPHRSFDPQRAVFLDGILIKTSRMTFLGTYEFINQMWLDVWYEYESSRNVTDATVGKNHNAALRVRVDF